MPRPKKEVITRGSKLRCAVYTRKSSEEGLEQEFNSLDAQREACLSYVASQKHEGWSALPDVYNDGGFSGGTMERPGLQRLLAEVEAGRVDVIVVYKVDRLTRSLADFAKIVEILDKGRVSFVSVTQAFNTTTSMGRLTLNVLLSFAQFEREVTGERIRDKIAASKKKGMWMGGQPLLGYDVRDRKLVVNEGEAETVRHIFARYRARCSVRQLKAELDAAGLVSKQRVGRGGRSYGGQPFSTGTLYCVLSNRIYRGEITHKGVTYPGEHQAIIEGELWDEVQAVMAGNRTMRDMNPATATSLLTGLVYDAAGERLTPTHATKRGTRYRYYVSLPIIKGTAPAGSGQRIPAESLEALVTARLRELLLDPSTILQALDLGASRHRGIMTAASQLAGELPMLDHTARRQLALAALTRVQVHPDRIEVTANPSRIVAWLDGSEQPDVDATAPSLMLIIPAVTKRAGVEMRFVVVGDEQRSPEPALVRLLTQAHRIRGRMLASSELTIEEAAREEDVGPSYATRLIRLAFLAPDITSSILAGRQPVELTARGLMSDTRLPLDWSEQCRALGFAN